MATWQHLRSSTANKRPTTSLADGRIAINTNTASPGLFFKDSAGTGIVKVGPVHVGTTAPNSVPAAGGSSGNYTGEQWLDTSVSPAQMKVWNGSTWVGIVADELPVSKLQDGAARQLIQTDAAGTGVEWTSDVDVPGTLDVTSTATFDSIAQHPLGTAGAPTITFTGDNNTGIYSPGADQVAISTGGSGRLFVDASGNVGVKGSTVITTSAASAPTFQVGDGNGSPAMVMYSSSTGQSQISFADTTTNTGSYDGYILYNQNSQYLALGTAASERLRITSAGLVGVGTSTPSAKLTVQGGTTESNVIRVTDNSSYTFELGRSKDNAGSFGYIGGTGGTGLTLGANNTEAVRIDTSGRVGVGTTSPGFTLDVKTAGGRAVVTDSGTGMKIAGLTAAGAEAYAGFQGNPVVFLTDGAERLRIDSSGRVGIGTSTPGQALDVAGTIQSTATTATGFNQCFDTSGVTTGRAQLRLRNSSGDIIAGVENSAGNTTLTGAAANSGFIGTFTNTPFYLAQNGSIRATVTSTGLGIGTTSASANLHVSASSGTAIKITETNNGVTGALQATSSGPSLGSDTNHPLIFYTNAVEKARLTASGQLLVGTSSSATAGQLAPYSRLQVMGNTVSEFGILSLARNEAASGITAGENLGAIAFVDSAGNDYAWIQALADGTAGTNDYPGRLVFSTTADGASSPTERMRIGNGGLTSIGGVYTFTTGNAANVNVDSSGYLQRSTSSIKYKTDVETLDDQYADALLACRPVWYRSTCEHDCSEHSYWGFIAEEVASIDPRLVHWKTTEITHDENGAAVSTPCTPEPEGVQYERFVPHLLNLIKRQKEQIEAMEARLTALESA